MNHQLINFPRAETIRLIVVDNHELFGECLALTLATREDLWLIERVTEPAQALEKIRAHQPDVLLISTNLGDNFALELTKQVTSELVQVRVIVLGLNDAERMVLECIEAGASGYTLQHDSLDKLFLTISSVCRGEAVCSPQVAYRTFARIAELKRIQDDRWTFDGEGLTGRELEILQLIVDGLSNKQIADRLCVSLHTVKNHVHNILNKLKVYGRAEAAYYGMSRGLQRRQSV